MNNEQIIIKGERYSFKKISLIWLAITAVFLLILHLTLYQYLYNFRYDDCSDEHRSSYCEFCAKKLTLEQCARREAAFYLLFTLLLPFGLSLLSFGFFFLLTYSMQLIVTNKRVYGKTYFGRSVDLPLDSITSVGSSWFKGIGVATSSGKISFLLIENAKEIHEQIRTLLIERQDEKKK